MGGSEEVSVFIVAAVVVVVLYRVVNWIGACMVHKLSRWCSFLDISYMD